MSSFYQKAQKCTYTSRRRRCNNIVEQLDEQSLLNAEGPYTVGLIIILFQKESSNPHSLRNRPTALTYMYMYRTQCQTNGVTFFRLQSRTSFEPRTRIL